MNQEEDPHLHCTGRTKTSGKGSGAVADMDIVAHWINGSLGLDVLTQTGDSLDYAPQESNELYVALPRMYDREQASHSWLSREKLKDLVQISIATISSSPSFLIDDYSSMLICFRSCSNQCIFVRLSEGVSFVLRSLSAGYILAFPIVSTR